MPHKQGWKVAGRGLSPPRMLNFQEWGRRKFCHSWTYISLLAPPGVRIGMLLLRHRERGSRTCSTHQNYSNWLLSRYSPKCRGISDLDRFNSVSEACTWAKKSTTTSWTGNSSTRCPGAPSVFKKLCACVIKAKAATTKSWKNSWLKSASLRKTWSAS